MRKCCVPGCYSNHQGPYVPTFLFPKDEDRRKLWERNIGRQDTKIGNDVGVCVKHFLDIYVIRHETTADDDGQKPKKTLKLKKQAVPSIFPDKTSKDVTVKRRRRRTTSKGIRSKREKPESSPVSNQNSPNKPSPTKVVLVQDPATLKELLQKPSVTNRPIISIIKAEDVTEGEMDVMDVHISDSHEPEENVSFQEPEPQVPPSAISGSKQDDSLLVIKVKPPKGRSPSIGSNSSNGSNETPKQILSPVAKRRKIEKPPPTVIGKQNDVFCWVCHKDPANLPCCACKRAFHMRCAGEAECASDWVCPECTSMLQSGNMESRSKTLSEISIDKFGSLLKTCLNRLKCRAPTAFHQPVPVEYYRNYLDFVIHPMDLSLIEKKIKQKLYGCTEVFLADVKWIQHNSTVFNGAQHPLTVTARKLVRTAEVDMSEIEVCPDCYMHASMKTHKYWFADLCETPHPIVWAKLKGFPYWPAKIVKLDKVKDEVDARFFGAHDRAWVTRSQCYHLSKEMPTSSKPKKKQAYEIALEELDIHVKLLKQKYGTFDYAPYRTPFNPANKIYSFHGIDIDKISKKTDACFSSMQSHLYPSEKTPSAQLDTSSEIQIVEGEKGCADVSRRLSQASASSSYDNSSSCPNEPSAQNFDVEMKEPEDANTGNHREAKEIELDLISNQNQAKACGQQDKDPQKNSDVNDGTKGEENALNSELVNDHQIKHKVIELDDVLTPSSQENVKSSVLNAESSVDPDETAPLLPSCNSDKVENSDGKDSIFDSTSVLNSNIENLKKLESALERIKDFIFDDGISGKITDSSKLKTPEKESPDFSKTGEVAQNSNEINGDFEKFSENNGASEISCSNIESTLSFLKDQGQNSFKSFLSLQETESHSSIKTLPSPQENQTQNSIQASLNLHENQAQNSLEACPSFQENQSQNSLKSSSNLLEDQIKKSDDLVLHDRNIKADDLKTKSSTEINSCIGNEKSSDIDAAKTSEDVALSLAASKKLDFFALKLGKTIESCKAKLGITDLSEDHSSSVSDSGEDEDDDEEEEDDDDDDNENEDSSESEDNEEISSGEELEETSEDSSDDNDDDDEPEEIENKDSAVSLRVEQTTSEVNEISKVAETSNKIDDTKLDTSTIDDSTEKPSVSVENSSQLKHSVEPEFKSPSDKDNTTQIEKDQVPENQADPNQKFDNSKAKSPTKVQEDVKDVDITTDIVSPLSPDVCMEGEQLNTTDEVSILVQKKAEPKVLDVIDLSDSESENETQSPEKSGTSAQLPINNVSTNLAYPSTSKNLEFTIDSEDSSREATLDPHASTHAKENEDNHKDINGHPEFVNSTKSLSKTNVLNTANGFNVLAKDIKGNAYSHDKGLNDEGSMEVDVSPCKDAKETENSDVVSIHIDEVCPEIIMSDDLPSDLNRITPCQTSGKISAGKKESSEACEAMKEPQTSSTKDSGSVSTTSSVKRQLAFESEDNNDVESLKKEIQELKEQLDLIKSKYKTKDISHFHDKAGLRHTMNVIITEMRASLETDKKVALDCLQQKLESEKIKAIEETKGKQWCALCKNAAIFLCCWNASYCSHVCQKQHWPQHGPNCSQVKMLPSTSSKSSPTEYVKIAKKPTVSEMMEPNHLDKKVYLLNLKSPDIITSNIVTQPESVPKTSSQNSLPKVQFVASNQFRKITPGSSAVSPSTTITPKPPVQIVLTSVPSQMKTIQDSSDIITKVRSRETDLNTAIKLLNKLNKETVEMSFSQLKPEILPAPPRAVENKLSAETCDQSDLSFNDASDEDDAGEAMFKLNYGVQISKKQLEHCMSAATNPTRLVRSMMEVLFPDPQMLAECCVFGRKSNVTKKTRPALKMEVVNAILDFVKSVYPSSQKADLVLAMNLKCKEARRAFLQGETNTEPAVQNSVKRKAEAEEESSIKIQKVDLVRTSLNSPSPSSITTLACLAPQLAKCVTTSIRTLRPSLRPRQTTPLQFTSPNSGVPIRSSHILARATHMSATPKILSNIPIKPKPMIVAIDNSSNKLKFVQNVFQVASSSTSKDAGSSKPLSVDTQGEVLLKTGVEVKTELSDGSMKTGNTNEPSVSAVSPSSENHSPILILGHPVSTSSENSSNASQVISDVKDESSSTSFS